MKRRAGSKEAEVLSATDGCLVEPIDVRLDDAMGFLFRRLSSMADAAFVAAASEPDLTPMQMGVLLTVERNPHASLRELARDMFADRSTVQELVKRMVDRGLLHKQVNVADRRSHELSITKSGSEVLRRNHLVVNRVQEQILCALTENERKAVLVLLHKLLSSQ